MGGGISSGMGGLHISSGKQMQIKGSVNKF